MADPHVTVTDLVRTFVVRTRSGAFHRDARAVRAVDDISFEVPRGQLCGYLGPNGAGKSTTVKILTGILTPTSGEVRVAGFDPSRQRLALARRIGVVFGQRTQLWWDLPLMDSYSLLRHVYGVAAGRHRRNLDRLADLLELGPLLDTPVRQLSLGQRMRAELAAALLHDPELIYLDEPTIGLDIVSQQRVRDFLAELNREQGVTVLLTTHDLDDVEQLCTRVLVIDHGRLIHDGSLDSLRRRYGGGRTVVVDLVEVAPPLDVPGARTVRVEGARQWLRFHAEDTTASEVVAAVAERTAIRDLAVHEVAIDEVVRRLYSGDGRGADRDAP